MANDPRQLRHGEKRFSFVTSEKGRDRADAHRQIEGLNQQDQIIWLLREQSQLLAEQNHLMRGQNEMLQYLCNTVFDVSRGVAAIYEQAGTGAPGGDVTPEPDRRANP